ncbi:hypothetical protein O3P69_013386 [Scylla paramamosain]|uniref:Uncharacterized protein n=1 Tax=Scylla paramamosain TaxID=85552 RepID=A0AAW0U0R0_SCYPA
MIYGTNTLECEIVIDDIPVRGEPCVDGTQEGCSDHGATPRILMEWIAKTQKVNERENRTLLAAQSCEIIEVQDHVQVSTLITQAEKARDGLRALARGGECGKRGHCEGNLIGGCEVSPLPSASAPRHSEVQQPAPLTACVSLAREKRRRSSPDWILERSTRGARCVSSLDEMPWVQRPYEGSSVARCDFDGKKLDRTPPHLASSSPTGGL